MGPLNGVRIIEIAGRGPGPFAGMMLADMGADVIRIDRPAEDVGPWMPDPRLEVVARGRRSLIVDLKTPEGPDVLLKLVEDADVLFEGFRPGVAERLGIGPDPCLDTNPRLVYGRATGWGQDGPLAHAAGHDINYIALTGALNAIGRAGSPPAIPLNLIGDNAGGGMGLAFGIVCGLLEARVSGRGQVIDAAMVDGASLLMSIFHGRLASGTWSDVRADNYVDSGAPFYDVYETEDARYVAVGPIEPRFQRELYSRIGLDTTGLSDPVTRTDWPELRRRLEVLFRSKSRDTWCRLLEGTDACFSPVLNLREAPKHSHMAARNGFIEANGVLQPAPAPRLSRTAGEVRYPPPLPGEHSDEILIEHGFSRSRIDALRSSETVA